MNKQDYIDGAESALLHTYNRFPLVIDHGDGVYLYDTDGKEYLDFAAGIAVQAFGYNNKEYNDALKAQIDKVMHTSNLYYNVPIMNAAKRVLNASQMNRVFFTNSGTEAIEGAIKAAKKYAYTRDGHAGHEIIAMNHSFHGRSIGALSVTGNKHYQEPFEPLLPGVKFADFNDLDSVKALINDKTCAIIFETVQGEGGIYPATEEFLKGVRALCDEHDLLLILDEIQCGMGRTGTMWRCEAEGVVPDIMTFGKAFGGGIMPITGIICRPQMWVQQLIDNPWLLGSPTFGGNPVCCSAAIATIKYMIDNDIPGQCASKGKILKAGLESLKAKYPEIIDDVRGLGLMLAVEFKTCDIGYSVAKGLFSRGVMTAGTLVNAKCIRFEPTAVITEEQIAQVIERMDAALADTKKEFEL